MSCGVLIKLSFDLLCPSIDDLYRVKTLLKSSNSIIHHTVVLQTAFRPAIVTFRKEDSLKLFQDLQKEDWEKVLRKRSEILLLK